MNKVAVVILNWNGKKLLEQFLPSVVQYSSSDADVVVIDNASNDDSIAYLKEKYPMVRIVENDQNYGYAGGYNEGLKKINYEYYVLLNSDVEVTKNWISPVINLLEKEDAIVACQPKIKDFKNKDYFEYAGAAGGFIDMYGYPFCRGRIFNSIEKDNNQYNEITEVFWASGACLFIKSKIYHELNGLDEFFFAHMEEIDLCWRIKNNGFKIMYCPSSTVYHLGGATLDKSKPMKTYLNFRNNLLILFKNLPKKELLKVILIRLFLDSIAGLKFLLSGKFTHTWAIVKSHASFYKIIRTNQVKRTSFQSLYLTGKLDKSIVLNYFLKGIDKYSTLIK